MAIEKFDPSQPSRTNPLGEKWYGVTEMLEHLKGHIATMLPSREHSMAITKIDEAVMWLQKGARS